MCATFQVSGSRVAYSSFTNRSIHDVQSILDKTVLAFSNMSLYAFLRGGIDIGLWYYDKAKDLLVSPAMAKAYKDERDRACYPVIAISDQLYRLLRDHPLRKVYSKDIDPFPDQFSSFKHLKSGKRVRFIKYLRLVAPSLDWQYDKSNA